MEKPRSLGERCDEITANIDAALDEYDDTRLAKYGEICLEPMVVFKQDAITDMEFLLAQKVERGELTDDQAAEAYADFVTWMDAPDEVRAITDPTQGLF